jgi:YD repeat-containing protein
MPKFKSIAMSAASAALVVISGFSLPLQAAPIGSQNWLQSAQQAIGKPVQGTPTVAGASGPATTPAFESTNSMLIVSGNQTETEVDFQTGGLYPLSLVRTYGQGGGSTLFGSGWTTNLDIRLGLSGLVGSTPTTITAYRRDGAQLVYSWNGTDYRNASPDANNWITRSGSGTSQTFTLAFKSGAVETYNASGLVTSTVDETGIGLTFIYTTTVPYSLTAVTHTNGHTIRFTHANNSNLITAVTDPAGNIYNYSYTASTGFLNGVAYPNGDSRTYAYVSANGFFRLASILVNGAPYRTFSYNSNGTAAQNGYLDGSAQKATFTYGTNTTTVTNASGL